MKKEIDYKKFFDEKIRPKLGKIRKVAEYKSVYCEFAKKRDRLDKAIPTNLLNDADKHPLAKMKRLQACGIVRITKSGGKYYLYEEATNTPVYQWSELDKLIEKNLEALRLHMLEDPEIFELCKKITGKGSIAEILAYMKIDLKLFNGVIEELQKNGVKTVVRGYGRIMIHRQPNHWDNTTKTNSDLSDWLIRRA